jgi:Tol biopolymer transport system component
LKSSPTSASFPTIITAMNATEVIETAIPSAPTGVSESERVNGQLLISLDNQNKMVLYSLDDKTQQQVLDFTPGLVSISNDGEMLAYLSNGTIYIKNLITSETAQFDYETSGNMNGRIAWSPDGTKIGFGCYSETSYHLELCLLNLESGERKELTNFFLNGFQSNVGKDGVTVGNWSMEGSKIVFLTQIFPEISGHARGIIQLYSTEDNNIHTVLDEEKVPDLIRFRAPSISPDGSTVLFSAKSGATYAIYQVNSDGSHLERVTPEAYLFDITVPIWSPDGKFFVAYSQDQNSQEIFGTPTLFTSDGEIITQLGFEGTARAWIN